MYILVFIAILRSLVVETVIFIAMKVLQKTSVQMDEAPEQLLVTVFVKHTKDKIFHMRERPPVQQVRANGNHASSHEIVVHTCMEPGLLQ